MRRGTPSLPLLDWQRWRTAAHRCPATRRNPGPRTTGLRAARERQLCSCGRHAAPQEDVVAFRVAGVGIAFQDQRFFAVLSHCLDQLRGTGVVVES